jgi:hypothetical protein
MVISAEVNRHSLGSVQMRQIRLEDYARIKIII